ncbi:hypothetical protein HELRODRAFT_168638 [Helobdella robusta]|uniref:Uncharacterized protein n=1 Tax=Helobdella robusta TaxID=6412 RepID=T1F0T9_HELRO|nr:hypothetical protein HELRODRAFT_168638 [Helobdella robusta]ESO08725.1 hypothetical protein HELRODRAFT_168638 [Helobdella robusta]
MNVLSSLYETAGITMEAVLKIYFVGGMRFRKIISANAFVRSACITTGLDAMVTNIDECKYTSVCQEMHCGCVNKVGYFKCVCTSVKHYLKHMLTAIIIFETVIIVPQIILNFFS